MSCFHFNISTRNRFHGKGFGREVAARLRRIVENLYSGAHEERRRCLPAAGGLCQPHGVRCCSQGESGTIEESPRRERRRFDGQFGPERERRERADQQRQPGVPLRCERSIRSNAERRRELQHQRHAPYFAARGEDEASRRVHSCVHRLLPLQRRRSRRAILPGKRESLRCHADGETAEGRHARHDHAQAAQRFTKHVRADERLDRGFGSLLQSEVPDRNYTSVDRHRRMENAVSGMDRGNQRPNRFDDWLTKFFSHFFVPL